MTLHVLDDADAEAIEAANWYEDRSPGLGYDFAGLTSVRNLRHRCRGCLQHPRKNP